MKTDCIVLTFTTKEGQRNFAKRYEEVRSRSSVKVGSRRGSVHCELETLRLATSVLKQSSQVSKGNKQLRVKNHRK